VVENHAKFVVPSGSGPARRRRLEPVIHTVHDRASRLVDAQGLASGIQAKTGMVEATGHLFVGDELTWPRGAIQLSGLTANLLVPDSEGSSESTTPLSMTYWSLAL